jgi:hypothetical protein
MTAELEELVVNADRTYAEYLFPDFREGRFDFAAWPYELGAQIRTGV